mmetsp:Transcript_4898/g.11156  ORF Transcript_4898/g.11156 Transcript_4898/m.11156 type:complete len:91 (-) Transcript_4898:82-354(-)
MCLTCLTLKAQCLAASGGRESLGKKGSCPMCVFRKQRPLAKDHMSNQMLRGAEGEARRLAFKHAEIATRSLCSLAISLTSRLHSFTSRLH